MEFHDGNGVEMTIQVNPGLYPTNDQMRDVMGTFCTGVTVISGMDDNGNPVGFTAQSLTSLSLDPPLISISPARTSTTWPLIRSNGAFCVNVLSEDQRHVSGAFARSGGDKFSGLEWNVRDGHPAPRIEGSLAWISCVIEAEHEAGDHTLVIGRVVALEASRSVRPLVFFDGSYRSLA